MAEPRSQRFVLSQSQPNPFVAEAGATVIGFTLESQVHTKLRVFDASGRLVRVLVNEPLGAGPHAVRWDGRSDGGTEVGSGIYYYRLDAGEFSAARALVKVR
jgi:flagellar hook assembly protein FlgD